MIHKHIYIYICISEMNVMETRMCVKLDFLSVCV